MGSCLYLFYKLYSFQKAVPFPEPYKQVIDNNTSILNRVKRNRVEHGVAIKLLDFSNPQGGN